jgi:hypothetical protein
MQKYGCKTDINCPEMACSSCAIRVKILRVIEILQEKSQPDHDHDHEFSLRSLIWAPKQKINKSSDALTTDAFAIDLLQNRHLH